MYNDSDRLGTNVIIIDSRARVTPSETHRRRYRRLESSRPCRSTVSPAMVYARPAD